MYLQIFSWKILLAKKILKRLPILGKIAAGIPILAQENIEGYLPYDDNDADFLPTYPW